MDDVITEIGLRIAELRSGTDARCSFVVARDGQLLAADGDASDLDTTFLAQRVGAQMTATDVKGRLLRERGYDLYDPQHDLNLHVALMSRRVILVVIYDARSSLGLVRHGARKTESELDSLLRSDPRFPEIDADDIDDLF